jgi:hypothetical protein
MVPRFLSALALSAGLAAMLAGGGLAAQQPAQAQKPEAEPVGLKPKIPKPWPPGAETLAKDKLKAEALPLFASQDPIEIVLTADWKAVQRDRNVESKKLYPATLAIKKDGAAGTPIPIEVRTRGNVRRNPRLCSFAPLRLELPKEGVKGTVFEGQGGIKLGVHCQGDGVYQQYMLKEFLANRLHNVVTPRSLRVRLAKVTYADKDPGKEPYTKLGIFYEDADDMAARAEARELPVPRQMFQYLDQPSLLFMSLFNYMIGNVDYSILTLHNVIMIDDVKGARLPVPYDFDYSGLVNAHYAIPAKGLEISSVRDRLYRGPCKTEAEVNQALQPFRDKQAEMLALVASMEPLGLDEGPRKSTEKYLNEFFELIGKPDKVKKTFVTDCKPIGGM